jgi:hypothetical protein
MHVWHPWGHPMDTRHAENHEFRIFGHVDLIMSLQHNILLVRNLHWQGRAFLPLQHCTWVHNALALHKMDIHISFSGEAVTRGLSKSYTLPLSTPLETCYY